MNQQFEELEENGYTVFPGFLDTETTARIRAHMDALLPPVAPRDDANAKRLHTMRHPIPGEIMAEILANPRLIELAGQLLKSDDLRLLEQVLIRTDPADQEPGARGWHVDMPFFPAHYNAAPRQTYFHMVHALNPVAPHSGAFTIVPGSHKKTYAASAKMSSEEELDLLKSNPAEIAGVDISEALEVLPEDGDLLVFNPMALHSASANVGEQSRYVYFASFFDPSAEYLQRRLNEKNVRGHFPDSLRDNLPEELKSLLA
jgi:ectoine hydroxylase-related dioxygenase (phytanoyl-CoA dioxygenase family)